MRALKHTRGLYTWSECLGMQDKGWKLEKYKICGLKLSCEFSQVFPTGVRYFNDADNEAREQRVLDYLAKK